MSMSRRDFIKSQALAAATATATGAAVIPIASAAPAPGEVRWDKAACRFCGTGFTGLSSPQSASG